MATDKEIEFALENQFDGWDKFLLVQELLEGQARIKTLEERLQTVKENIDFYGKCHNRSQLINKALKEE